jgi:hypothetical protein
VDERVKRLLAAWNEWSILSPNFLLGLEAAFIESEADARAYQLLESETFSDLVTKPDAIENNAAEFESLVRQAKMNGVFVSKTATVNSLRKRLMKAQGYDLSQSQTKSAEEDSNKEEEDLDGIPLPLTDVDDAKYDECNDDEDVDGIPMDIPFSSSDDIAILTNAEEDIDGVPFDVDGIPM